MSTGAAARLVLLRHAKSAWPDVADHERPLGPRGLRDAPAAGRWLRDAGCLPALVICSTALRARETWTLAAGQLGIEVPVLFDERVYAAEPEDLLEVMSEVPEEVRTLLLVSHNPGLADLAVSSPGRPWTPRRPRRSSACPRSSRRPLSRCSPASVPGKNSCQALPG